MLIHQCVECADISINRIAADDDPESIILIFRDSLLHPDHIHALCEEQGIIILGSEAGDIVYQQLYGVRIHDNYEVLSGVKGDCHV